MLVLLRIVLAVGLIFWFSPARRSIEAPSPAAPDLDRIGPLIEAWEKLPPEVRAAALDAAGSPLKAAARKPGG